MYKIYIHIVTIDNIRPLNVDYHYDTYTLRTSGTKYNYALLFELDRKNSDLKSWFIIYFLE